MTIDMEVRVPSAVSFTLHVPTGGATPSTRTVECPHCKEQHLAGPRTFPITVVLCQHDKITSTLGGGIGVPGDGGSLMFMPREYTLTVREVERLLRVLRDSYHAPLEHTSAGKVSRRRLWWHANEYYIRALPVMRRPAKIPRSKGKALKAALLDEDGRALPIRVMQRHPEASKVLAQCAVEWIAEHWALTHEPMLPQELLAAA